MAYDEEVKACSFPAEEHTFAISDEVMKELN
jgi:3-methyl-2-oxobutanoate hydroxymethyltransferase